MESDLRVHAFLRLSIMRSECLGGLIEFALTTHRALVTELEPGLNAFFMKDVVTRGVKGFHDGFEADRAVRHGSSQRYLIRGHLYQISLKIQSS